MGDFKDSRLEDSDPERRFPRQEGHGRRLPCTPQLGVSALDWGWGRWGSREGELRGVVETLVHGPGPPAGGGVSLAARALPAPHLVCWAWTHHRRLRGEELVPGEKLVLNSTEECCEACRKFKPVTADGAPCNGGQGQSGRWSSGKGGGGRGEGVSIPVLRASAPQRMTHPAGSRPLAQCGTFAMDLTPGASWASAAFTTWCVHWCRPRFAAQHRLKGGMHAPRLQAPPTPHPPCHSLGHGTPPSCLAQTWRRCQASPRPGPSARRPSWCGGGVLRDTARVELRAGTAPRAGTERRPRLGRGRGNLALGSPSPMSPPLPPSPTSYAKEARAPCATATCLQDPAADRRYHVVVSAQGRAVHWQSRIHYYHYRKVQRVCRKQPVCHVSGAALGEGGSGGYFGGRGEGGKLVGRGCGAALAMDPGPCPPPSVCPPSRARGGPRSPAITHAVAPPRVSCRWAATPGCCTAARPTT